ncbi:hypothetical protein BaRGS_00001600 [Batillaria attramentaria]|uniref:Uncharacterized protein n=1 Tax=Batillaria attramentaria TaxID=370345 RepID=A0ABD0M6T8_9CAEN
MLTKSLSVSVCFPDRNGGIRNTVSGGYEPLAEAVSSRAAAEMTMARPVFCLQHLSAFSITWHSGRQSDTMATQQNSRGFQPVVGVVISLKQKAASAQSFVHDVLTGHRMSQRQQLRAERNLGPLFCLSISPGAPTPAALFQRLSGSKIKLRLASERDEDLIAPTISSTRRIPVMNHVVCEMTELSARAQSAVTF